jgi:hypothetical protein
MVAMPAWSVVRVAAMVLRTPVMAGLVPTDLAT